MLDLAANDFTAAADSLAKTGAVWARLKPVILLHDGSDAATRFEKSLATQQAAREAGNASAIRDEANNTPALIDELERLFQASSKV